MHIHPLPIALHRLLVDAGVNTFVLDFDRRLRDLDVRLDVNNVINHEPLIAAIENWAEIYEYDFEGDDESGDYIEYELISEWTSHTTWYMKKHHEKPIVQSLNII